MFWPHLPFDILPILFWVFLIALLGTASNSMLSWAAFARELAAGALMPRRSAASL